MRMTGDDLLDWLGHRGAAVRWDHDERGRQVVEVVLACDVVAGSHVVRVAANEQVTQRDLVEQAVERLADEMDAEARRGLLRPVSG